MKLLTALFMLFSLSNAFADLGDKDVCFVLLTPKQASRELCLFKKSGAHYVSVKTILSKGLATTFRATVENNGDEEWIKLGAIMNYGTANLQIGSGSEVYFGKSRDIQNPSKFVFSVQITATNGGAYVFQTLENDYLKN